MANILCTLCETALESISTKLWLNGPGVLVSVEPSIACDSQGCYIVNNFLSTTVCFSMLNFQLLTIKESSFLKRKWLLRFWAVFSVCLLLTARYVLSCQQLILSLVCALDWISCQWHLLSIWSSFWKLNVSLRGNIVSL